MNLTPYQRGNRDGLLSLAKKVQEHIEGIHYKKIANYQYERDNKASPRSWSAKQGLNILIQNQQDALTWEEIFLKRLLTAAEALPEDPEVPTTQETT